MKNYMNRWVLLALKAIVILVWLACLWGQLFAVPGLSGVRGRMETVLLVRLGRELEQVI